MKAVAYQNPLPITDELSLMDVELPDPEPTGRDVLVEVRAISANPIDTKVRRTVSAAERMWKVLGWDATGVVRAVGEDVSLFKVGDEVWYAGDITRAGANSELHVVDERVVGRKPKTLSFAEAAALPLTGITAWEILFDRLLITKNGSAKKTIIVIGAGGGVGSIMVQLLRELTSFTIIGTASRPDTHDWLKQLGVHHVINHHEPLAPQLAAVGIESVDYVASLTHTHLYFEQLAQLLAPQGRFALIDDPEYIDVRLLKRKSISLNWESMFTRSMFKTDDMIAQHDLLNELADLVDAGRIKSTVAERLGLINAENLRRAHALLESGRSRGKIVLEGF